MPPGRTTWRLRARSAPGYRSSLVAPALLSDGDFGKFRTDLGQLLEFIKYSKDKEALDSVIHKGDRYRSLDADVANLIKDVTGADVRLDVREGKVDMCEAIEEMKRETAERVERETAERVKREMTESAERETAHHVRQLMENLGLTASKAMDAMGIPAERRAGYMAML